MKKKCHKKWKKSIISLTLPLSPNDLDFLKCGKNLKFDDTLPHPPRANCDKFEIDIDLNPYKIATFYI